VYFFANDNTNIVCSRFLAADLTGETVMTVPTIACTSNVTAWTDGTYAYVASAQSSTTSRKWSVSGTTFTAESTATISGIVDGNASSFWDGSFAYTSNGLSPTDILKLTLIDGSTKTTTTHPYSFFSDVSNTTGAIICSIDSKRMYLGYLYNYFGEINADTQTATILHLMPITKP